MTRQVYNFREHVDHPGKMLKKYYLPSIGISNQQATQLAKLLQVPRKDVAKVLQGKAPLSDEMCKALGRVFNTTMFFWKLMQSIYDESDKEYRHGKDDPGGESLEGEVVRSHRV